MKLCTDKDQPQHGEARRCARSPAACKPEEGCLERGCPLDAAAVDLGARFSRAGDSHPLGKCTDSLEISLPPEMKADISAIATLQGKTASEFARQVLTDHVYGKKLQLQAIVNR